MAGKSVYWKEWRAVGIERIKDLQDEENSFLGFEQFCRKTGLKPPFPKYHGLISAIPYKWKCDLRSSASKQAPKKRRLRHLAPMNILVKVFANC